MSLDDRLHAWLRAVFSMLKNNRSCFDHGSFVIETTRSAKLESFLQELKAASHRRLVSGTHRLLLSPRLHQRYRICKQDITRPCNDIHITPTSKQMEYKLKPKLKTLCDSRSSPKGVVLFNSFSYASRRFVFIKLEENVGVSIGHAVDAFRHYIMDSKKNMDTRQEDDFRMHSVTGIVNRAANDILVLQSAAAKLGLSAAKHDGIRKQSNFYTKNVRVGNEFFLPGPLADSLLPTDTATQK